MEKILKVKHWQIFIIAFALPIVLDIIGMISIKIEGNTIIMTRMFPIILLFFMGGALSWLWVVAIHIQKKLPDELRLKVTAFKILFFIPIAYVAFIFALFGCIISECFFPSHATMSLILGFIVFLHLFSMFCIFYCLYFAAKTFKTMELQRKVSFSDYAGEFFLFLFFPIGIWIIQPKINKMVEN
jgi:hypothetical protein